MMLENVLNHIHNWFVKTTQAGTFVIDDGQLAYDGLQEGQYFRIVGSVFNDGLHQWPASDLTDEEFVGYVQGLAIPKAVIDLSDEISEWMTKYGEAVSGPYQSESFADYSYTKATSGSDSGGGPVTWQSVFRSSLSPWRKIG